VRKSRIKETWALMASSERQDDDIRKFEEIGTHPAANHDAICEALTFNQNIGIERKSGALALSEGPLDGATRAESQGENPAQFESGDVSGIGMFGLVGADPQKLVTALHAKHAIYTALMPHEEYTGIRITPSVYTTLAELDYFTKAVDKELKG